MSEDESKAYGKVLCDNIKLLYENLELLQLEKELCNKLVVKERALNVAVFGALFSVGLCLFLNDCEK